MVLTVEVVCDHPIGGSHSAWSGTTFGPGDNVTYTCDTGYEGPGSLLTNTLTCGTNGYWSGYPFNCTGMYLLLWLSEKVYRS